MNGAAKEALRQQMLLRALLGDARPAVVGGWLRAAPSGRRHERGLAAYRANAGALAERALAAAFPTLQQLLGDEAFGHLARAFWQRQPPLAGDMGLWGGELPTFIAAAESLADEPYLADVARLEWAVHEAERAVDVAPPQGLELLATHDPADLRLHLVPGTAVLASAHPVVSIWQAHRSSHDDRFAPVRAAFAAGVAENALVVRQAWRAEVRAIDAAELRFVTALLAGVSLATALQESGAGLDFEAWLIVALQQQRLAAVTITTAPTPSTATRAHP